MSSTVNLSIRFKTFLSNVTSVKGMSHHRLNCKTVIEYALLLLIRNLVSVEENLRNSPSPNAVSPWSCRGKIKRLWAECRRIVLVVEAVWVWVRDDRSVNSTPPRLDRYTQRNDCRVDVAITISLDSRQSYHVLTSLSDIRCSHPDSKPNTTG
jgi:hypothetical protein